VVFVAFVLVLVGAGVLMDCGRRRSRVEHRLRALGGGLDEMPSVRPRRSFRDLIAPGTPGTRRWRTAASSSAGALLGFQLAGLPGTILGVTAGAAGIRMLDRRTARSRTQAVERQLADLVDACTLAVRGGASVSQAFEVAASEVEEPMASIVGRAVSEQRLGASFDSVLSSISSAIGSEDARLFALVMGIHHRSGGNVAAPLEEVAATVRQRVAIRRELRALTAQGRISGAVLGILPVAFFVVLATTSHRELAPVYRSAAGAAMVVGGLVLEAIAYVWIRHLLKVEA
jgi:tight adherence protein B